MTLLTTLFTPTLTPQASGYLPSLEDVSARLRARLRARGGSVPLTFNDQTEPTAAEVLVLIQQEASTVLIDTGSLSADKLICSDADNILAAARALIAKRVAAVVELSFWPDSVVNSGPSAADYWQQIVQTDQPALVAAARECRLGDVVPGEEQQQATAPAYRFDTVRLPNSW